MQSLKDVEQLFSSILPSTKLEIRDKHLHILPETTQDVQNIQRLAYKHNITLFVQSMGKDWGYSDLKDFDIVLNLRNMNNILEFNEKLAYIRIEPGVTFQQVYEYLKKQKSQLMITTTGGPPDGSILATTLLRGIGKGLYGDLFSHCCNLEVVLQSGEIINTGFGSYENSVVKNVYKWGAGPTLDGLFSQSTIGVVTKMTIWLTPKPIHYSIYSFKLKNDQQLRKLIPVIQYLKMNHIIEENFLLTNHYRMLSLKRQFPWELTSNIPLDARIMRKLMSEIGLKDKWIASSIIYSDNKELVITKQHIIQEKLAPIVDDLQFVTSDVVQKLKKSGKSTQDIEDTPFFGVPTDKALKILYWRKKIPVPTDIDPIRDNCGIYWINVVLPFSEDVIRSVVTITEQMLDEFKFEQNIGLNFISERAIYLIGMILYDKDIAEEEQRARACYDRIIKKFAEMGIYSARLSREERQIKDMSQQSIIYKSILNSIKENRKK